MAEINDFDPTDANNVGRWPEDMLGGAINNAGRADEGILARWFRDWNYSIAASGSSNAFAITSNRTISSLANNTVMGFTANHAITGAATLNLNGIGAKSIKRFNGNGLAEGDIISGQPVLVCFKTAADAWFMLTAPAALTGNSFADFDENAAPGDPAANDARLYAKDDAGVTIMAYRDSDGTERELLQSAVINRAYAEYTANANLSTLIPADDTIPQQTEGTEILTAAITLTKSTNRVRARFQGFASGTVSGAYTVALFLDSANDALAADAQVRSAEGGLPEFKFTLEFEHAPGSVGPLTYKVRAGPSATGSIRFNGSISARFYGGAARATLVLEEIHV